jgi:hypothetical protein
LRSGSAWIACQYHSRRALAALVSGSLIARVEGLSALLL